MTLEEAIKHCIELAEKNEEECKNWTYGASRINDDESRKKQYLKHAEWWHERAKEHQQLAEWLRELQIYRKKLTEIEEAVNFYKGCESCQGFREYPTDKFVEDLVRILEVNANE